MSNAVGLTNKESIQVFQQNGNYYIKKQDGITTVTTKQYYDEVQTISASNAQILENNKAVLNDPLAHFETDSKTYSNPMSSNANSGSNTLDDFNKGYQKGQQYAEILTGTAEVIMPMIENWLANRQRRLENEYNQQKALKEYEKKKALEDEKKVRQHFQKDYLDKYLTDAEKGNENVRLILYLKSIYYSLKFIASGETKSYFNITDMLPNHKQWLFEAFKNNNFDAMNLLIQDQTSLENYIGLLEKAANLGSEDAMIQLGNYYSKKPYVGSKYGGNDSVKALHWYTQATEHGSPKGAYYLGMIYRYGYSNVQFVPGGGNTIKNYYVKLAKVDNIKAYEWFTKSISNPNYLESHYANHFKDIIFAGASTKDINASIFEKESYIELSTMNKKGLGCLKNEVKANEFYEEYQK
jgi:hypothetical protein